LSKAGKLGGYKARRSASPDTKKSNRLKPSKLSSLQASQPLARNFFDLF
jgi:hypothetical protein